MRDHGAATVKGADQSDMMTSRKASGGYSQVFAFGPTIAALLTRMSILPKRASVASVAASTAARSAISTVDRERGQMRRTWTVLPSKSWSRSQIATFRRTEYRVVTASPMPWAAPVTIATWSFRS